MKNHPKGFASLADFPELQPYTEPVKVLDQGFIRLVSLMGSDGDIVTTARVTTGKGRSKHVPSKAEARVGPGGGSLTYTCSVCGEEVRNTFEAEKPDVNGIYKARPREEPVCVEGDRRMLRFMFKHHHLSPFEFAEAVFHLRIPMDAWRQMVRHRTASVSEYSTRYSPAVDAMMETDPTEWRLQSGSNRQGSDGFVSEWPEEWNTGGLPKAVKCKTYSGPPGEYLSGREQDLHLLAHEVYEERLAFGVAKEQARKDLPLSNYTDVFWKCDLRNLLHFLSLRMDGHAQKEIRDYANVIGEVVTAWCPIIYEAFVDYEFEAKTLSRMDLNTLRGALGALRDSIGYESEDGISVIENLLRAHCAENKLSSRETTDLIALLLSESK